MRPIRKRKYPHDRFISTRTGIDARDCCRKHDEDSDASLMPDSDIPEPYSDNQRLLFYKALLRSQVLSPTLKAHNIHAPYVDENRAPDIQPHPALSFTVYGRNEGPFSEYSWSPARGFEGIALDPALIVGRKIPKVPAKILDAPGLQDDYYLDVIDWSKNNVVAVGLDSSLYLWTASTSGVVKLHELEDGDTVASVAWASQQNWLAVGSSHGIAQVWDVEALKPIKSEKLHEGRIGSTCWRPGSAFITTGSRDKTVIHRDIRANPQVIARLAAHKQEVCGVRWSADGHFVSSGGNDNKIVVWTKDKLTSTYEKLSAHKAAVKALAWSPHQHGLLASGGGTADRCIRLWDVTRGVMTRCIDTGAQVCNMVWNVQANELVSAHGYSQNNIIVWQYPSFKKLAVLPGHLCRVLYLSLSPDGKTIVTPSLIRSALPLEPCLLSPPCLLPFSTYERIEETVDTPVTVRRKNKTIE